MRTKTHARSFQYNQMFHRWAAACCHQLDHAIAPLGSASLILGLVAAFLEMSRMANYLLAMGLLFHLTVWFAGWLGSVRRK